MTDESVQHIWGAVNDRPVIPKHVQELIKEFKATTIRRCARDTAIPLVIREELLSTNESFCNKSEPCGDIAVYPSLQEVITVTSVAPLGGQHRYQAIRLHVAQSKKWLDRSEKEEQVLLTCVSKAEKDETKLNQLNETLRKLQGEMAERQRDVENGGKWLYAIYNKCE